MGLTLGLRFYCVGEDLLSVPESFRIPNDSRE